MVDKTTESIERTCLAWSFRHNLPSTQKGVAWIEILRIGDGSGEITTSFNVLTLVRPIVRTG